MRLNKNFFFISLICLGFLISCSDSNPIDSEEGLIGSDIDSSQSNSTKSNDGAEFVPEITDCGIRSTEDFRNFLGFKFKDDEKLITSKLGKFSSGNFSQDSLYFIYYYDRVPRVPLQIWINAKSGKIVTIFMEVLSLKKLFNEDLQAAKTEYNLKKCDLNWFGLTAEQIIGILGEPAEDAVSKDNIRLLTYDSSDYEIAVAFKIYPQENKCSSIAVNWFFDEHN